MEYIIECERVNKSFRDVRVLDEVCFGVRAGEILMLLGENGAGKTSLVKILCGVYTKDSGTVSFYGSPVERLTSKKSRQLGLAVIRRDDLCPNLTVTDNIFLGWEALYGRRFRGGTKAKNEESAKILRWLGLDINPNLPLEKLPRSHTVFVGIAKAIAVNARVIIFDEPSSILSVNEMQKLFGILLKLRDEKNIGIIYLCNRVDELIQMADRVTIMKNGSVIKSAPASEFSMEEYIYFVGMRQFAESLSETRAMARILANAFSKENQSDLDGEAVIVFLQELAASLAQLPSARQSADAEADANMGPHMSAMLDFTDAFNAMLFQLADRYQAIFEAKREAEAASESKSAFMATMSHEIRTPLNAIIGLSEIQLQNDLPAETRSDMEKIHRSGMALLGIASDILDISHLEAGNFELNPAEYGVSALIGDALRLNAAQSEDVAFEVRIDPAIPSMLYGDKQRVRQILNNLLSNAFKHTSKGNVSLRVSWRCEEENGGDGELVFGVKDTGVGMKKEDVKKLFSDYTQLDTRASRSVNGTGAGLFITKKLTEMMGGSVSVKSLYGIGSKFEAVIRQKNPGAAPIGEEAARSLENFQAAGHGGHGSRGNQGSQEGGREFKRSYMPYGRVLVVDDVPTNLDVAKGLMLPYGLTVDFADSGPEAIEKIRDGRVKYDVVFMDHMMPEMDGIEATRVIREEIGTDYARGLPVVTLTANALAGNREMFLANGFTDFLSKPINIEKLDAILNKWVRDKQDEETLRLAEQGVAQAKDGKPAVIPKVLEKMHVEGVDMQAGARRYGGETVYFDLLRSFADHTPELLGRLRDLEEGGFSGEGLAEYAITVHGIKGAAYGICANEAGLYAEALELAAKGGDFQAARAGNGEFIEFVENLISGLREFLRRAENISEPAAPKELAHAPDENLLFSLLKAARHFRTSHMEEAISALERFEYESGGELVAWLSEQMNNLEYDAIRERLENLLSDEAN